MCHGSQFFDTHKAPLEYFFTFHWLTSVLPKIVMNKITGRVWRRCGDARIRDAPICFVVIITISDVFFFFFFVSASKNKWLKKENGNDNDRRTTALIIDKTIDGRNHPSVHWNPLGSFSSNRVDKMGRRKIETAFEILIKIGGETADG